VRVWKSCLKRAVSSVKHVRMQFCIARVFISHFWVQCLQNVCR